MKLRKILVVDDNIDFLNELHETLSLSGYETISVCNGKTVIEMAREIKPDIVLVDLKMDGMNGFEVAETLRDFPETKRIPVIAMSGYFASSGHSEIVRKHGFVSFLQKPFNPLDLVAQIENAFADNSNSKTQP